MKKIWIDISAPPHATFFRSYIKDLERSDDREVIVTARDFGSVTDILDLANIDYVQVGEHGGDTLRGKLTKSAERIKELGELIAEEEPDVGLGKHSVEGPRVSFGLGVPWITLLDHETGHMQNKLMLPTSQRVVCPDMVDRDYIESLTEATIDNFHGVFEYGAYFDTGREANVYDVLDLDEEKKIVMVRAEPYLSSHVYHDSKVYEVTEKLLDEKDDLQVVFFPRNSKDKKKFSQLDVKVVSEEEKKVISPLEVYPELNLMLGAGCTMNREASMCNVPTLSMYPDDLPAPDRLLIQKGVMEYTRDEEKGYELAVKMLNNCTEKSNEIEKLKSEMTDPYDKLKHVISDVLNDQK